MLWVALTNIEREKFWIEKVLVLGPLKGEIHVSNWSGNLRPHRTGSGKQPGEEGYADTMAMASILQNTFTLYEYLSDIPSTGQGSVYFEDHGEALAQVLFQVYVELQQNQRRFQVPDKQLCEQLRS